MQLAHQHFNFDLDNLEVHMSNLDVPMSVDEQHLNTSVSKAPVKVKVFLMFVPIICRHLSTPFVLMRQTKFCC